MNYTYILECEDDTYYTGWTNDLQKRYQAHQSGKGAKYTKSHRPRRIAFYTVFTTKKEAMREEWRIKHMSRKEKEELIKSPLKNYQLFDENKLKRKKFMSGLHIFYAPSTGQVIMKMNDLSSKIFCDNELFVELPIQDNENWETHEPVISRKGDTISVNIGSDDHPMDEDHHIEFVILMYDKGYRVVYFEPGEKANVEFYPNEPVVAVYAYCNQHGLWYMC
ncbi:MAG: GIY-YIG nuclease family protein [Erysipelotrichaceae bacterium]|nr:GIY-YIG nuclease family protein [Erysipelotrichaceae bacterium]MDY6035664.1 GIY-YIG nuclease family protein [Bulleidia sp.]